MPFEPGGVYNYHTDQKSRAPSTKNVSEEKGEELIETAKKNLDHSETYVWDANINGITVRLVTDSFHQYDFWQENWYPASNVPGEEPDAYLYSVQNVSEEDMHAYYIPDKYTAVFFNTEYYGQCKSWALGIAAHKLEEKGWHSIHGACAEVNGVGIALVAPTGTGKTTQVNRLFQLDNAYIVGDDWIYINHNEDSLPVRQPERSLYVRTENAEEEEWLRPIFDHCKLENVITHPAECRHDKGEVCGLEERDVCYWGFGNSRAIIPREWMLGTDKVKNETSLDLVVLLRRDDESPAVVELDADEAVAVLREGAYQIRPGAGPKEKWGETGYEPWYNPYLLYEDHDAQAAFFRREAEHAKCLLLNTGVQSIAETREAILDAVNDLQ
jgi:hypothetical protein